MKPAFREFAPYLVGKVPSYRHVTGGKVDVDTNFQFVQGHEQAQGINGKDLRGAEPKSSASRVEPNIHYPNSKLDVGVARQPLFHSTLNSLVYSVIGVASWTPLGAQRRAFLIRMPSA